MFISYDPSWMDPNSSWWAKANRAKEHIDSLRALVDEFRATEPYSLTPEHTDTPGRLAYRLRFRSALPVAIITTVGDVLHNQRAAYEHLAYELARRSQSGALPAGMEHRPTFPICKDPASFDKFAKDHSDVYDDRSITALRQAQPFVYLEEAHRLDVALDRTFEDDFRWSIIPRLHALWNIDKHRRLAVLAWWPGLIYWSSNGPSNRRLLSGDGTVTDGSILFYMEGSDEGQGDKVSHEFNLVLTDDPAFSREPSGAQDDVVDLLENWQQHLQLVFQQIFTIMSQRPPPDQASDLTP